VFCTVMRMCVTADPEAGWGRTRWDGVRVADAPVPAVNAKLTSAEVVDDLSSPGNGVGLGPVVAARSLTAGLDDVPAPFRVRYDVSAAVHSHPVLPMIGRYARIPALTIRVPAGTDERG